MVHYYLQILEVFQLKKIILLISLLTSLVLSGCSTIPMASVENDSKAKTYATKPGRANIYIYRDELLGGAVQIPVSVNGVPLGKTAAKTYFLVDVPAGKHTIFSSAENDSTFVLDAEPGKNYFIWQEVKMGLLYARNVLQLVDDNKGKLGISECKLIDNQVKF